MSRWARGWKALKAKPHYWMNNYPEIFFTLCMATPVITFNLSYKLYRDGLPTDLATFGFQTPPYYRHYYEVRRPNDPIVQKWRVPEDYPAPCFYHRPGIWPSRTFKDHAWDVK